MSSNEWFTPLKYVEAAREVMSSIDLDPASCEVANQTVKAARYYTQENDGLSKSWYGKVWLNPPYGLITQQEYGTRFKGGGATPNAKSLQVMFVNKALREYGLGNIEQAILLVTANTTVKWFQPLWDYPMCTPYPKIGFIIPGSAERQRQVFGNVFVYLGTNEHKFIDIFSQFGTVTKRVSKPVHNVSQLELVRVA